MAKHNREHGNRVRDQGEERSTSTLERPIIASRSVFIPLYVVFLNSPTVTSLTGEAEYGDDSLRRTFTD